MEDKPTTVTETAPAPRKRTGRARNVSLRPLLLLAVVVLLIFGVFRLWSWWRGDTSADRNSYQAVFLNNGQVYFGHLSDLDKEYVKLTDVFYLQTAQEVQQGRRSNRDKQESQISLVKLGNEIHGPKDLMHIAKDEITFWEDLKNDGKVAKTIAEYYERNK